MNNPSDSAGERLTWDAVSLEERRKYFEALQRDFEIFGESCDLPPDEWAIVFESNLPDEEMMARLIVLRAGKGVVPRSFAERMTQAGRIHARGLGILLD